MLKRQIQMLFLFVVVGGLLLAGLSTRGVDPSVVEGGVVWGG